MGVHAPQVCECTCGRALCSGAVQWARPHVCRAWYSQMGFREGRAEASEDVLQAAFNSGFADGGRLGDLVGRVQGFLAVQHAGLGAVSAASRATVEDIEADFGAWIKRLQREGALCLSEALGAFELLLERCQTC